MPKAKNNLADEALALYRQGLLLKDIAEKLGVPPGTVRRWKSTYKWDSEQPNVRKEKNAKKRTVLNDQLTEKQALFCMYYIENFNATKAYQKAYECEYSTAMTNGSMALRNAKVKEEIQRLTAECLEEQEIESKLLNKRLMDKYIAIAFADITDFIEFGNEEKEVIADNGEEKTIRVSNVILKNDYEVDGTIITEVSKGKDGIKVKLGDRMQAMKWLDDHLGLATEEQRTRIKMLEAKIVQTNAGSGSDEAINKLDEILESVKDNAIKQQAE